MGAPLPNERMDASDPALPVRKGERTRAPSANQPGKPEGMALPWLMTMPSPSEDINIGVRRDDKLEPARRHSVPEGPSPACMPAGPGSTSPAFPTIGEDGTPSSSHPGKRAGVAPWLMTTPPLDDAISEKRNPAETAETYVALERLLHIAEHENGNSHAALESSAESPKENACAPELSPPTTGLELKEEIANLDTRPHPAETYVGPSTHIATTAKHENGNPHAAPESSAENSKENSDASAPELPRTTPGLEWKGERAGADTRPHPAETYVAPEADIATSATHKSGNSHAEDEIASVAQANQLERDWIRVVSVVPNADPFSSCIEGSKQSDVAVPTQGRRKGGILIATIFTASALCIWATALRPLSELPRRAEMTSTPASVSTREGTVEAQAQEVQKSSGRTEPYSQPTLSSHPESPVGADILLATQPSPNLTEDGSTPTRPTPAAEQKNGSDVKNSVALAPSENSRSPQTAQRAGGPLAWRSFEVPEFGTRIQIPAGIFTPSGKPEQGSGQRFERADGRAVLSIYSRPNNMGQSPATYLRHNLRVDRSALDYERIARSFFAISLERDGVILYSRCNFSSRVRAAIHCFDLTYPQEEKRSWDGVVTRISLSLRPLEG